MNHISQSIKAKAIQLIKEGEGLRLQKYNDSLGYPTIGYGHLILQGETFQKPITIQQAQEQMQTQLNKKSYPQVENYWGEILDRLSEERIAVLIDMTFNMGSVRWPKLTKAIEQEDFEEAGKQIMNSKYATQVKKRAVRNSRIMCENKLYNYGNLPK